MEAAARGSILLATALALSAGGLAAQGQAPVVLYRELAAAPAGAKIVTTTSR